MRNWLLTTRLFRNVIQILHDSIISDTEAGRDAIGFYKYREPGFLFTDWNANNVIFSTLFLALSKYPGFLFFRLRKRTVRDAT